MQPLASTAVLATAAGAVLVIGERGSLSPPAEKWWTTARDRMRLSEGIPPEWGQTLITIHQSLVRRAMNDVGPNPLDKNYPAPQTNAELSTLCKHWLAAVPIWSVALADTAQPPAYFNLRDRAAELAELDGFPWGDNLTSPEKALAVWRACRDFAATADAMRFSRVATGVTGDHADGIWDYIDLGARKTGGVAVGAAKGVLFDPIADALSGAVPKLLPLAIAAGIGLAAVFLVHRAIT